MEATPQAIPPIYETGEINETVSITFAIVFLSGPCRKSRRDAPDVSCQMNARRRVLPWPLSQPYLPRHDLKSSLCVPVRTR